MEPPNLRSFRFFRLALALCFMAFVSCLPHNATTTSTSTSTSTVTPAAPPPRLLEDLGDQKHPISTLSERAQRYFDQGMILTFGFNHEAAIASFEEALRLDPQCGMCHWGIALALGPNINAPMGPQAAARAYEEIQQARILTEEGHTPRERAYVEALSTRYAAPDATETNSMAADRSALDRAYVDAMRALHQADPSDDDAAILFAEALMDLYPWSYWTPEGEPREFTNEIVDTLESVLARNPEHVGGNHYYIHAVEEFFPEKGEAAADRLGSLSPDAGHLVHMPSHIYWRVGRYEDAAEINQRASEADERFFAWCRPGAFYRVAYYPHNLHFLWAAAMTEGRQGLALMTARKLAATTRPGVEQVPILQEFLAIPMLTLARFGQWDALLGEPRPPEEQVYVLGIWHYTRGLAEIRTGATEEAIQSRQALAAALQDGRAEDLPLSGGTANARALLQIGLAHLDGEIAIAAGEESRAVASLQRASELHDALPYMEPPPWYAPPRQALGALLLELGRAEEAERVYLADLRQYPKNGWSLFGLAQSLRARGDTVRADWADQGFDQAWARAEIELSRSSL
jgi:tetratricopeptide (TPR) repeat protein